MKQGSTPAPRKLGLRSRWLLRWHNWRIKFAVNTRTKLRRELTQHLENGLQGLQKRLHKRYIPELCRLTIAQESNVRGLARENPEQRRSSFADLLVHAVDRLLLDRQQRRSRFNSLSRQCALVFDERAYDALIDDYLQNDADGILGYLADRRATARRLDLDALRERCDEQCHRNRVLIEIASRAIVQLWTSVIGAPGEPGVEGRARALQSQPQRELLRVLFRIQDDTAQIQIAQDIASLLSTQIFSPLDDSDVERLLGMLEDAENHPWLRRNVFRIIYINCPEQAFDRCARLLDPDRTPRPDAFVLRTLLIQDLSRLCELDPRALALVQAQWLGVEPSEHVRICLAQCMGQVSADPIEIISWLAKRVCLHRSDLPTEPSPKVRAMAMDTISGLMASQLHDGSTAQSPALAFAAQAIDSCLQDEHDPWVCIQVCKQIQKILMFILDTPNPDHFRSQLRAWSHGLSYRLADPSSGIALANEAGATLDLIDITLDPRARLALPELVQAVSGIAPGRRKTLKMTQAIAGLSRDRMGQILGWMSRNNWGIYVKLQPGRLCVQRGDRFRLRLWRILHEIAHPSPNKRKGFVHSTGRVFRGDLRAHPFGLDEATATVVPGERVSLGQGLGWGRHLPSVDDLAELPWRRAQRPLELHHSYGKTVLRFSPGPWKNWARWFKITWNYAQLARLRQASLQATDAKGRGAFVAHLHEHYQIHIEFQARPRPFQSDGESCPEPVIEQLSHRRSRPGESRAACILAPLAFIDLDPLTWLQSQAHYFFSKQGNDQNSLSLFLTLALGLFLFQAYWRRRSIRIARDKIPLSIGGWGTRGKSGAERLKAALFHGLGYRVLSKTTGCEAMFIHSMAQGPQSEIFVFRPYAKATIWEQANLLKLASKLNADVFLWECMALNPTYVSILQHGWMNDDLATITNAYPDHEDIQGPAGHNVAKVISTFIPKRSIAISSELNFHPLMRDRAHAQRSEYSWVKPDQEAWIGEDFLALFPYQEHPRNVALVAQMGERLGIEPDQSLYNMATQVVPDLGVLSIYGDLRIKGRITRFINGCSANERAGFLNNWERTGCHLMDPDSEPHRMIATVVNNRADRVSRSEVFARILVNDAAADKHVLIGTNLSGLIGYLKDAVREFLTAHPLLPTGQVPDPQSTFDRFEQAVARFRCPSPHPQAWIERLDLYARACGSSLVKDKMQALEDQLRTLFDAPLQLPESFGAMHAQLQADQTLRSILQTSLAPEGSVATDSIVECLAPPSLEDVYAHWYQGLAKCLTIHRLRQGLAACLKSPTPAQVQAYVHSFQAGFSQLFEESLHPILDPDIKGDQIIVQCVELFPPGVQLTLLGSQNIKGTGLDLVYRWVAFGQVQQELEKLRSRNPQTRQRALRALEAFGDHGLTDLGLLRQTLPTLRARSESESAALTRLGIKVQERYAQLLAGQNGASKSKLNRFTQVLDWLEGWIEFLDGARRYHQSKSLSRDLIHRRVSHARATLEMRDICGRNKGGWLAKWWKNLHDEMTSNNGAFDSSGPLDPNRDAHR